MNRNFSSIKNYSFMLALMSLLHKLDKFVAVFNSEEQVSSWLAGGRSVVTKTSFFEKSPSLADVTNHVDLIATCLYNEEVHISKAQTRSLTTGLIEYAVNEVYTFRGSQVYKAFEKVAKRAGPAKTFILIEALLVKQSELVDRPVLKEVSEVSVKAQNAELQSRMVNCAKILVEELFKADSELTLTYNQFTLVLQVFCHPLSSPNMKSLGSSFGFLERTFKL